MMRPRRLAAIACLAALTVGSGPATAPAADAGPAAKADARPAFTATCVVYREHDGKREVVTEPRLLMVEGQPGSVFVGTEVPIKSGDAVSMVPVGLSVRIEVRRLPGGDAHLLAHVTSSRAVPAGKDAADATVHEVGVTAGRAVKFGQPVTLTLQDGTRVDVTIDPAGK